MTNGLNDYEFRPLFFAPLISVHLIAGEASPIANQGGPMMVMTHQFLTAIADQVAVAAENARLFAEIQDKAALEERQ